MERKSTELFKTNLKEHFIFNALNSAISLCRRNPCEASELLVDISQCLHYASRDKGELVLLEEEVEFIKSYLRIQCTRFASRLSVHYDFLNIPHQNIPCMSIYMEVDRLLSIYLKSTNTEISFKLCICKKYNQLSFQIIINDKCEFMKNV